MIERTSAQESSNITNDINKQQEQTNETTSMFFSLLKRMNPGLCLCGETMMGDNDTFTKDEFCRTEARLESEITRILMEITNEEKENDYQRQNSGHGTKTCTISACEELHELSKARSNR
jgi:hypothetical protein